MTATDHCFHLKPLKHDPESDGVNQRFLFFDTFRFLC